MTNEERQLLLKDLCARLPYEVRLRINRRVVEQLYSIDKHKNTEDWFVNGVNIDLVEIKPYLRLMSSMTEEEKEELFQLMGCGTDIKRIDFYISHHFDYRGLIEKSLAIVAPEGMYKIE